MITLWDLEKSVIETRIGLDWLNNASDGNFSKAVLNIRVLLPELCCPH